MVLEVTYAQLQKVAALAVNASPCTVGVDKEHVFTEFDVKKGIAITEYNGRQVNLFIEWMKDEKLGLYKEYVKEGVIWLSGYFPPWKRGGYRLHVPDIRYQTWAKVYPTYPCLFAAAGVKIPPMHWTEV